jgi:hypothetical protein
MAVVVLASTFNSVAWIGRVYPGFFLWQNNFVPAIGVAGAPPVRAGLQYHSRLVAVDGAPVRDRGAVHALVASKPLGSVFRYTLEKDGRRYEVELPSIRLSAAAFLLTLGNYLANAIVLLALGIAVIFLEPASRGARAFFAFCANWGLYLATSADIVGPSWFHYLYFFLVALCPATSLQLVLDFPAIPARLARLRVLLPLLYAAGPVLAVATLAAFRWSFPLLLALDRATHLAMASVGALVLGILVVALRRPPSPAARERLRVMLLGLAGAFCVPVLVVATVYTTGAAVPFNYLTLGFFVFPAAIAYAIARHDFFGVDRLIRRTVAYATVSVLIALLYAALLAYVDYVVVPDRPLSPAIHILITMLLVALFEPLRTRVQAFVDLVYSRVPYDYRRTVATASRALASLLDLDEIVRRLVDIITQQMRVEHAHVWLHDRARGVVRRQGAPGAGPSPTPLLDYLAAHPGRVLYAGQGAMGGRAPQAALDALDAAGATLAVPMFFEQRLVGFLALGEKRSGHLYTSEDVELLATLANQAAVAVQNARAYRALAEANRELREARDQLVEAERLAAIGELSAAVAHGIRNPLAGIKMAAELAVREAGVDDPLRETLTDILTEADALEARIGDLLDFAKPFVPTYAPADLGEIVRGTIHLLRRQIADHAITVEKVLPPPFRLTSSTPRRSSRSASRSSPTRSRPCRPGERSRPRCASGRAVLAMTARRAARSSSACATPGTGSRRTCCRASSSSSSRTRRTGPGWASRS